MTLGMFFNIIFPSTFHFAFRMCQAVPDDADSDADVADGATSASDSEADVDGGSDSEGIASGVQRFLTENIPPPPPLNDPPCF